MFASTSRERGLAIRSAPLRTLLFTALDLSRYSVGSMLSDFWHTFCRGHPRRARTMGRAKTPFLFVQIVDVGRTNRNADREKASVEVARHVAVIQGYLFEGLDPWVHRPREGEGSIWVANQSPH